MISFIRYDMEYMKYYTNIDVKLTTAYSGFYTNGYPYKPSKPEILSAGRIGRLITGEDKGRSISIVSLKKLYPKYTLEDLVSHRVSLLKAYNKWPYHEACCTNNGTNI